MAPPCHAIPPKCHTSKLLLLRYLGPNRGTKERSRFPPREVKTAGPAADETRSLDLKMPALDDPEIYRDILDELQIGVSVLDLQRRIVFWSDGAERISGYPRVEVLGHFCSDNLLQHCNEDSCEMCAKRCPIAAALHGERPAETISFIHHRAGHRVPVRNWAIPLRNRAGAIIGMIQTFEADAAATEVVPHEPRLQERRWMDLATGLPHRAMMEKHLRDTFQNFSVLHVPFSVVLLEFREISLFRSRYGQEAATLMLQVLARTLRNGLWPTDFAGRWEESQFLAILCGCTEEALQAVASRIGRMMSNANIVWWGQELAVAVGVAHTTAMPGDTQESVIRRVQESMLASQQPASASKSQSAVAR